MLHIRLSRIAADPPALDNCVAYIKSAARQTLEFRLGSLGISVLADRVEGAALYESVWASWEAMSASEDTEAPLREELADRAGAPVTVEEYQLPISVIFDPAILLLGGQAVRLTRIQVRPAQVDDVIEVAGDEVVPSLSEAAGFRAVLLFADPASGRMISETIWRDPRAREAAPSVAAIIRREFPDEAGSDIPGFPDEGGAEIGGVADYGLVYSSVRTPDSALTSCSPGIGILTPSDLVVPEARGSTGGRGLADRKVPGDGRPGAVPPAWNHLLGEDGPRAVPRSRTARLASAASPRVPGGRGTGNVPTVYLACAYEVPDLTVGIAHTWCREPIYLSIRCPT